ncbi:MFS transporter [Glycomyces buryatensis]|uniref:MFS transporter n=1 Tax=Glycomyces buryatensis TaxID=2570927 RepID=A0A4S8Q5W7_9ACTN|nr:MFS transporter [Glycomyces buryatensis]THV39490.1 MFS transporter [Glycomyces buryatensis]
MSNQNPKPAETTAQTDTEAGTEVPKPTFSDVFGNREAAAFLLAFCLSNAGAMLNRVAVTFLVWNNTGSSALAAASFAISFAPYLGLAQVLGAVVDRYPYRNVMVLCDFLRAALVALLLIPGLPVPIMIVIVFAVATVQPAYTASRTATLAQILKGEELAVAIALSLSASGVAQILGYLGGGLLAAIDPYAALGVNAALFALSGFAILGLVKYRPSVNKREDRRHVLTETADGLRMLRDNRVLRTISFAIWGLFALAAVPEGVAVLWAAHLGQGSATQGAIMATDAAAAIVGLLLFTRFVPPRLRDKLIRPLAFAAPLVLATALFDPPLAGVLAIAIGIGLSTAIMAPMNATLALCIPDGWRGRIVSAVNGGLQLAQGAAIAGVGLVAEFGVPVSYVVGAWGVIGLVIQFLVTRRWPTSEEIEAAKRAAAPPPESKD